MWRIALLLGPPAIRVGRRVNCASPVACGAARRRSDSVLGRGWLLSGAFQRRGTRHVLSVPLDLAVPSYNIESQGWVTVPLAANAGVRTAPYFDAGGGEIWMVTRSVPVREAEGVFALITTDLPVEDPGQ